MRVPLSPKFHGESFLSSGPGLGGALTPAMSASAAPAPSGLMASYLERVSHGGLPALAREGDSSAFLAETNMRARSLVMYVCDV